MSDNTDRIKKASENLKKIPSIVCADESQDTDPNKVLAYAYDNLNEVVIGGTDKDGNFWFSSSVADGGIVLWIIEHLKLQLMGVTTSVGNTIDE